jgi:translation initiation factor IF-2
VRDGRAAGRGRRASRPPFARPAVTGTPAVTGDDCRPARRRAATGPRTAGRPTASPRRALVFHPPPSAVTRATGIGRRQPAPPPRHRGPAQGALVAPCCSSPRRALDLDLDFGAARPRSGGQRPGGGARSPRAVSASHSAHPAATAGADGVPGTSVTARTAPPAAARDLTASRAGRPCRGPGRQQPDRPPRGSGVAGPAGGSCGRGARGRVRGEVGEGLGPAPGGAEQGVGARGGRVGGGIAAVVPVGVGRRRGVAPGGADLRVGERRDGGQAEGGERVHRESPPPGPRTSSSDPCRCAPIVRNGSVGGSRPDGP